MNRLNVQKRADTHTHTHIEFLSCSVVQYVLLNILDVSLAFVVSVLPKFKYYTLQIYVQLNQCNVIGFNIRKFTVN